MNKPPITTTDSNSRFGKKEKEWQFPSNMPEETKKKLLEKIRRTGKPPHQLPYYYDGPKLESEPE